MATDTAGGSGQPEDLERLATAVFLADLRDGKLEKERARLFAQQTGQLLEIMESSSGSAIGGIINSIERELSQHHVNDMRARFHQEEDLRWRRLFEGTNLTVRAQETIALLIRKGNSTDFALDFVQLADALSDGARANIMIALRALKRALDQFSAGERVEPVENAAEGTYILGVGDDDEPVFIPG